MSAQIQGWIHFLEEGRGARAIRISVATLGFIALAAIYNFGSFRDFSTEEAMDLAQLARNISQGQGYTTDYVRPLSITLIEARANELALLHEKLHDEDLSPGAKKLFTAQQNEVKKIVSLKSPHPDLANAPAYPVLLAGLLKIAPINYHIPPRGQFTTYSPEIWIAAFNQILFFLAAIVLYKIARQLFDPFIALVSAFLFLATDLFWRFSISGLPTMFLVLIFLCLAWTLLQFTCAAEKGHVRKTIFLSILAGAIVGAGCLTRYAFGWLMGAVIIFFLLFENLPRPRICLATLAAFFLVISPWLVRNYSWSGNLFGTAGYAICENTPAFPENRLERSLEDAPIFTKVFATDYFRKFMLNSRDIFENEIPRLGRNWLALFFMVGLLIPLPSKLQSRLRTFILLAMFFFWMPQTLGRTHLADDSPLLNSENLLVLLSPVMFGFGVAVYFDFLRKINFSEPIFPFAATCLFCTVISAPLIFTLLPPATNPITYPPYQPPLIQQISSWMRKNELMMSDVPWAVAWYGDRQCVPLTLTYPKDFFKLNDDIKTVQALYLTPKSAEALSRMVKDHQGWGQFLVESFSKEEVLPGFPLRKGPSGLLPEQLFLTDWERWGAKPK